MMGTFLFLGYYISMLLAEIVRKKSPQKEMKKC